MEALIASCLKVSQYDRKSMVIEFIAEVLTGSQKRRPDPAEVCVCACMCMCLSVHLFFQFCSKRNSNCIYGEIMAFYM